MHVSIKNGRDSGLVQMGMKLPTRSCISLNLTPSLQGEGQPGTDADQGAYPHLLARGVSGDCILYERISL